ncbi:MAG: histidine kinase [Clostridiales bacterium]|jgi:sensor histidine kinase YesM|nr:histidine kinase [Clostridiales bacterium]
MDKSTGVRRAFRDYGIKSVFFQYVFGFIGIILLIFIPFCFIVYQYYDYVLTNEIAEQSMISALQSKNIYESLTEDFHKNYNIASASRAVRDFLSVSWDPGPDGTGAPAAAAAAAELVFANARQLIHSLERGSNLVEQTYVYSFRSGVALSSDGLRRMAGADPADDWLKTYRATKLPFIMFPRKEGSEHFSAIYICSELYEEGKTVGLFCSKVDFARFSDIVVSTFVKRPDLIFIVSDIGLILYSDVAGMINKTMFERDDTYAAFNSAKNVDGNHILYGDYLISVAKSTESRLLIMSYSHRQNIAENYQFINFLILSGGGVIFLTSVILALFISFRHYRSVTGVLELLKKPGAQDRTSHLLSEFFHIAHYVTDISQKNELIANELTENLYRLKEAQIAALQAQIKPHFLFNTLQLINLSIISETKRDTIATQLISNLSSLLRDAYDTERYIVTVADEVKITQTYLDIQRVRYHSRLDIHYEIDPECLHRETIKLILQPLVENAIVHGFRGRDGQWLIRVSASADPLTGDMIYEVADNGAGMSDEAIDALNRRLADQDPARDARVGIANVNRRLRLVYGDRSRMEITRDIRGGGTRITIRHPSDTPN